MHETLQRVSAARLHASTIRHEVGSAGSADGVALLGGRFGKGGDKACASGEHHEADGEQERSQHGAFPVEIWPKHASQEAARKARAARKACIKSACFAAGRDSASLIARFAGKA